MPEAVDVPLRYRHQRLDVRQQIPMHHSAPDRPHLLTLGMAGYTSNGIIGQPSMATAAKGEALPYSFSAAARAHLNLIGTTGRP